MVDFDKHFHFIYLQYPNQVLMRENIVIFYLNRPLSFCPSLSRHHSDICSFTFYNEKHLLSNDFTTFLSLLGPMCFAHTKCIFRKMSTMKSTLETMKAVRYIQNTFDKVIIILPNDRSNQLKSKKTGKIGNKIIHTSEYGNLHNSMLAI